MAKSRRSGAAVIARAPMLAAPLALLCALGLSGMLVGCSPLGRTSDLRGLPASRPLPVPQLLEGRLGTDGVARYRLVAEAGRHEFGVGAPAGTIGFNGSYLGPTLQVRRGERVRVTVRNELREMTTVHWHGMHLPAVMDGGPHQMIEPGGVWSPTWRVDQPAATMWYHPHPHGDTAAQVYRGLAGMRWVVDPAAPDVGLPHEYGVDDIPVVVQDKSFTGSGELVVDPGGSASTGFLGDTVVVNGTVAPYLDLRTEAVRLRLLNAANARFFDFAMGDGRSFQVVASDGGLLARPVATDHIQLSPGERAEVVVRVAAGETVALVTRTPDLGHSLGVSHRFGTGDADVLQLRAAPRLQSSPQVSAVLTDLPIAREPTGVRVRPFRISGRAINGRPMDPGRIDEAVPVGREEVWEVMNQDPQPHNFHVHDGSFRVLSIDGQPPPTVLAGAKDTVYVPPRSTVRILVRFDRYTDPDHPYMFHCHLLLHEDLGVMGQFVVTGAGGDEPAGARDHLDAGQSRPESRSPLAPASKSK